MIYSYLAQALNAALLDHCANLQQVRSLSPAPPTPPLPRHQETFPKSNLVSFLPPQDQALRASCYLVLPGPPALSPARSNPCLTPYSGHSRSAGE
jgi:hypothetical protein